MRYKTLEGAQRHCHPGYAVRRHAESGWETYKLPKAVARRQQLGRWRASHIQELASTRSAARAADLRAQIERIDAELRESD